MNAQGVVGEVEDRYLASWVSENNKNTGMNVVFESRQLHAGLVFSKSVLFLPEFHIVAKTSFFNQKIQH